MMSILIIVFFNMANRANYVGSLCGTSVRFSPFEPNKLLVSQAQNFGIVGNGCVSVLSIEDNGTMNVVREYATQDACYDACFNEDNENQILTAGGDSTLKLWDFMHSKPVSSFEEHKQEVFSCEWSHIDKRKFLSSSYDQTVKVWDIMSPVSLHTFNHAFVVYQAVWHPTHESIIASCSGDETFRIWDLRISKDVKAVKAHDNEILTIDFNKYENYVATGSTDSSIKVWDLRATLDEPIMNLSGHILAVKKVKFSPYHANTLISVSYDMSTMIWNTSEMSSPLMNRFDNHSEFVVGLDCNLFIEKQIATTSWDKKTSVFNFDENPQLVA